LSRNDAELRVLEAVRQQERCGRAATAAEVARALGHDDRAAVVASLEALLAAGQVERDGSDDPCVDCDWPAAQVDGYRLTHWGRAALAAADGHRPSAAPMLVPAAGPRAIEDLVELGMQAFDKTGEVREALVEAVVQAWQAGHAEGEAGRASPRPAIA
jgi:hypothetical protein